MCQILRKVMYHVSAALFAISLAIAFIAVIFRYVFNNSLYWSEEIVRYISIWMFFFAIGEASRTGSHVALDLLPSHLHGRPQKVLEIVTETLCLLFNIVLVVYGFQLTKINMAQYSPALQIPYGCIYAALPFGGFMMGLFNVIRIVNIIRGKEGQETC